MAIQISGTTVIDNSRNITNVPTVTATTFSGCLNGNASTMSTLQTARNINGISFNGSANINVNISSPQTLTIGSYLTGSNYNGSGATTWAVDATTTNTANKIAARDASGNFSAGTITATLNGNATTATTLQTARTINGVSFNGSADIDVNATTGVYANGRGTRCVAAGLPVSASDYDSLFGGLV